MCDTNDDFILGYLLIIVILLIDCVVFAVRRKYNIKCVERIK